MNPQMQNYRQYQQQTPGRAPAVRRPGQVHPNAQYAAAQQAQIQSQQAQHRNAVLEHQAAQRRAKKPTDTSLPDGIDDYVPADVTIPQQYRDLQEAERKIDHIIMKKRLDLMENYKRVTKKPRNMRFWISNTAENQPWQVGGLDADTFDFNSGSDSTFQVTIEGQLFEDPKDDLFANSDDEEDGVEAPLDLPSLPKQHMSKFFKSCTVEFDGAKGNTADPNFQVEWKKGPNMDDIDRLRFKRRGDENMNITINLHRDEQPERFRLSNALAEALDMQEAERAEVVMGLWEYVKLFGLQEDEEKRSIRCDDMLRQIFGRDQIYFPQVPDLIMQHLHPLPPIQLRYTVRVDEAFINNPEPTVYDVVVNAEDPMRQRVMQFLNHSKHVERNRNIEKTNDEIAVIVQAAYRSKSRIDFFRAFAKDPISTSNKWLASQRRDLEVIMGEAARGGGEDGMGPEFSRGGPDGVWGSDQTREAVRYMLAKPEVGRT